MSRRRGGGRSKRSHVVELVLAAVAIAAIYGFLVSGGASAAGHFFADLFTRP
jgi:hypothetical protein